MTDVEFWGELRSNRLGFPSTQTPPEMQNRLGERDDMQERLHMR